jgi:Ca-activated chloride channel family protein
MLTLTPGDDLPSVQGNRDWTFILDVSGSMEGKYATLLEGVRQALVKLPPEDRFRLITFNDKARDMTGGYQRISSENVTRYIDQLQSNGTGGGTNLYAGLAKGLKRLDDDRSTAIVLVTDGVANVGVTEKKDFLTLVKENDVRLFTFIMGNSANRPMLQEMTALSNGFAASISNAEDVIGQVMLATSKLNHASMRDIEVSIQGGRVNDLTPEQINTVYRGQQLVLFGHYFEAGTAEVVLRGKVGAQERVYKTQVELAGVSKDNPELERLWAYSKIETLQQKMDYLGVDADTEQAMTDLAVQYGLVTDYTSLLVVEEDVFEQLGIKRTNKQRVSKEQQARQQRSQREHVQDNRADSNQPMFQQSRASTGGGAVESSLLLILLALGLPSLLIGFKANPVAIKTNKK